MARVVSRTPGKTVYTVELSQEELDILYQITRRIGGDPSTTRRRVTDQIGEALRRDATPGYETAADLHGSLDFDEAYDL